MNSSRNSSRILASVFATLIGCLALDTSHAAVQNAASRGGRTINTSAVPTGGLGNVWAYSESNAGVINQTVVVTPAVNGPAAPGPGFHVFVARVPVGFGPTVTVPAFKKPAGTIVDIDSTSVGNVKPIGTSHGQGLLAARADGTTFLQALADVTVNLKAFGRAADPQFFDDGQNHLLDSLDDVVLHADPNTLGAAFTMSMNSTLPGLATLYTLSISAAGGLLDAAGLVIDFVSNPLLGFNDSLIDNDLRASFSVAGFTATQTSPFVLSYTLDARSAYQLDYAVEAAAVANVPEPSTLSLYGIGGLLVLAVRRRRNRGRHAGDTPLPPAAAE